MTTRANATQTTLIVSGAGNTGRRGAQRPTARGLPAGVASRSSEQRIELFRHVLDGHNAHTTDGMAGTLRRLARDVRAHARAASASGAWQS
jgi:hypothetical protein